MKGKQITGIVKFGCALTFLAACATHPSTMARNQARTITVPGKYLVLQYPYGIVAGTPKPETDVDKLRAQLEALNRRMPGLMMKQRAPDVRILTELPKGEHRLLADLPKGEMRLIVHNRSK